MKVINVGNKNFHKWWYGSLVKCEDCGKEVELEMGDERSASTVEFSDNIFKFVCTNCYSRITVIKPDVE